MLFKKQLLMSLFISFVMLSTQNLIASPTTPMHCPEIEFKYDWRGRCIDFIGSLYYGNPVTNELVEQLEQQLPDFIATWERDAPILFGEVFSSFKRGFKAHQRTAIIYLSHSYSYGSDWFLIFGLRHYLDAQPWSLLTNREDTFSSVVFHELLHIWVDENINKKFHPSLQNIVTRMSAFWIICILWLYKNSHTTRLIVQTFSICLIRHIAHSKDQHIAAHGKLLMILRALIP